MVPSAAWLPLNAPGTPPLPRLIAAFATWDGAPRRMWLNSPSSCFSQYIILSNRIGSFRTLLNGTYAVEPFTNTFDIEPWLSSPPGRLQENATLSQRWARSGLGLDFSSGWPRWFSETLAFPKE